MMKFVRRGLSVIDSTKKVDIMSAITTSSVVHTLVDSLYLYTYLKDYYGYIIVDKRTKKMIAIDCGDYRNCRFNVEKFMKETNGSFDALFLTHGHENHIKGAIDWRRVHPELKIVGGDKFYPFVEVAEDGKIYFVGDLCIYCMKTPGHTEHDISYVITEVAPESSKTPVVFTGDTLYVGGCGKVISGKYEDFYKSLLKLKSLPNETLIFPGHENALENLTFAKVVDPQNKFVENKFDWVTKQKDANNFLVGSTMAEERLYNPYLRVDQPHFLELTKTSEPAMCFAKLRSVMSKIIS